MGGPSDRDVDNTFNEVPQAVKFGICSCMSLLSARGVLGIRARRPAWETAAQMWAGQALHTQPSAHLQQALLCSGVTAPGRETVSLKCWVTGRLQKKHIHLDLRNASV